MTSIIVTSGTWFYSTCFVVGAYLCRSSRVCSLGMPLSFCFRHCFSGDILYYIEGGVGVGEYLLIGNIKQNINHFLIS